MISTQVLIPPEEPTDDAPAPADDAPPATDDAPAPTQNIVEIALGMTETFSTLVGLLQAADLVDTLSGPGPFTVFAPTNDAFAKIDAATLEPLTKPEGKDLLTSTPVWRSN